MKYKKSDFLNGIISLVISQILIKIFGVIYTLYLTNKNNFGDTGNAIYMSGYQIYALLLTISSIGVPNAISKIISENNSIKDYENSRRIFLVSVFLFATIGFFGSLILFLGANFIAENLIKIPESTLSIKVLAPAVFFVSITSVIRGYCNGENKISITATSQFFEQVLKTIFTIILVEIFARISNNNTVIMAASANLATTLATIFSLLFILYKYLQIKKKRDITYFNRIKFPRKRIIEIIKSILAISMPITISAILSSIGKNIDSMTVVRILKDKIGEEIAIKKYGILSSKVDVLIAFPLSFNTAISTSLIPEISKRKAIGDLDGIIKKIEFSIMITSFIGIPCAFGMGFYSKQIFNLLFPKAQEGYELLKLASIGIIFSLLTQTIIGVLQGIGKNNIPVYTSLIGIIIKVILNIALIPIENIYEKGAIIGNIVSSFVSFVIVYIILKKNIDLKVGIIRNTFEPILASIIMIFLSYKFYNIMIMKKVSSAFCTINSIVIAVFIYIFCYILIKIVKKLF